jgi:AcrR family transcriptional regulator
MNGMTKQLSRGKASSTTAKGRERAQDILDAARAILTEVGYAELSMRAVAARLGVTLGNVQHYYKTKSALIEAMLVRSFENYQMQMDQIVEAMADQPATAKLTALVDFFVEDLKGASSQRLFFEIGALAIQDGTAAAIIDRLMARARKGFKKLIRTIDPAATERELGLRAALITAQLMGLAFQMGANRRRHGDLAGLEAAVRPAVLDLAKKAV